MKNRNQNIIAAYLVLCKNDQILLLQRQNTGYQDGNYGLVSGHVEAGESFTAAMIREAKEEAGIEILPEHLSVAHVMHRKSSEDASERVDVFFTAETWEGEICNVEPEKCSELSWFKLNELPQNTIPVVREAITHIQNKTHYSEFGWDTAQTI